MKKSRRFPMSRLATVSCEMRRSTRVQTKLRDIIIVAIIPELSLGLFLRVTIAYHISHDILFTVYLASVAVCIHGMETISSVMSHRWGKFSATSGFRSIHFTKHQKCVDSLFSVWISGSSNSTSGNMMIYCGICYTLNTYPYPNCPTLINK